MADIAYPAFITDSITSLSKGLLLKSISRPCSLVVEVLEDI